MMNSVKKFLYLIFTLLVLTGGTAYSQDPVVVTRSNNKIVLEGKIYYVHVVKKGQTLYSIARAYNSTEKAIIIENPGSSADLIVGQVLKIPAEQAAAAQINTGALAQDEKRHVLKEGETLYSVSRMYMCSVEDILQLNPNLEINNIPVGTSILLPSQEEVKNELSFDEQGYIFHNVKRGETLYSIARYYGVSVREIRAVNTELGWGGPRSGDMLRIPKPYTAAEEIFLQDSIPAEVMDTLLVLQDSLDEFEVYTFDDDEGNDQLLRNRDRRASKMYSVAYFIPFDYAEMQPLDSLLKDVKSALRRERIREEYMLEASKPKSVNFLEFLEGSLMALDSLSDAGMNLDIHVYDTKKSMSTTRQLLNLPEMKDMDLIIGPFYTYNLQLVSEFSKKNRIPMVTPFHSSDSLLFKNPYLFQPIPSYKTEFKRNASYIGRSYDSNLIFVHHGDSSEASKMEFYKQTLFEELETYSALQSVLFKEVIITDGNTDGLVHALKPGIKNLIILPAMDEAFASQVATRMYYELERFDIEIFGSSYWVGFDDIELSYIHALKLRISHTLWYDYEDAEFLNFLNEFRQNYKKEPSQYTRRGCNFGIIGYDLSFYFLSALDKYGPRFIVRLKDFETDATLCDFDFQKVSRSGGYENVNMRYYLFDTDLNVKEIELPDRPPIHHYMRPAGDDPYYLKSTEHRQDTTILKDL